MSGTKSKLPSVTVGICTYNERENIANCLKSCLKSDYPKEKLEIIIVDSSDDETPEIVKSFSDRGHIRLYTVPKSGKATAINEILKNSNTDVIVFVSGDCVLEKDSIKLVVDGLKDDFFGTTGRKIIRRNKNISTTFSKILWDIHHGLSLINPKMCGDLCAIKRGIVSEIPPETINDDRCMGALIERKDFFVKYIPKAIVEVLPYKNMKHYFKLRRRIIRGHMQSKSNDMSTDFGFLNTVKITLKEIFGNFRRLPFYLISILIESIAYLCAYIDKVRGIVPYKWKEP